MNSSFKLFADCTDTEELARELHHLGVTEYQLGCARTILAHPILYMKLVGCLQDLELDDEDE
jgi:hypothetical protein